MAYQHSTHTLTASADSKSLFWQKWLPKESIKRVLVFHHGMGEHAGRYQHMLDAFAGTGTAFYALDARGHGRTEGRRGGIPQFELLADDLEDLVQLARSENQQQRVFLLGHSMGGAVALDYTLRDNQQDNLRGLILSSPAVDVPSHAINRVLKAVAGVFVKVAPRVVIYNMLNQADLSRDTKTIDAYRSDPLVHGKASVTVGHTLFHLHKRFYKEANRLTIPVYLFHGTADRITNPEGSQKLFDRLTTEDKTIHLYEGLYHETMNELPADRKKVLEDLVQWVIQR